MRGVQEGEEVGPGTGHFRTPGARGSWEERKGEGQAKRLTKSEGA
jgi:hypothetical protein